MKVEIPDEFLEISKLLNTQDNGITSDPIFIVQNKERIWGMDSDYSDTCAYVNCEGSEFSEKELMNEYDLDDPYDVEDIEGITKSYYKDKWVNVQAFFTEKAANDFIKRNQHNYDELRTYADSLHRNPEMKLIRDWLKNLTQ